METPDWLQFVTEPFDGGMSPSSPPSFAESSSFQEKPVAEKSLASLHANISQPEQRMPTPPASSAGSPTDESDDPTIVSVSTTFFPAANLDSSSPDIVLLSLDKVFFYVHSHILRRASNNSFNGCLPTKELSPPPEKDSVGAVIPTPEPSTVLNVVLHALYGLSCAHYSPSPATLFAALDALASYGADVSAAAAPGTPLFALLLAQSPVAPLEVYAHAAHHGLHALAVAVSPHLLGLSLAALDDALAERMGPAYLKRLFFLHLGRVDALKRLLLPPPEGHAPTPHCDYLEQKKLTRAWALASAYLAWDCRPDLSTTAIELALKPLGDHLTCPICKASLQERTKHLMVQWALVKRTI